MLAIGTLCPVCWRSLEFRGLSTNPTQSNSINRIQSFQSIHSDRIQSNQSQYNSNHIILSQFNTFQQSQSNQSNQSILACAFSFHGLKCYMFQVSCTSTLLNHWCSQFIGCSIDVPCSPWNPEDPTFCVIPWPSWATWVPWAPCTFEELTAMLFTLAMSIMAYTWS